METTQVKYPVYWTNAECTHTASRYGGWCQHNGIVLELGTYGMQATQVIPGVRDRQTQIIHALRDADGCSQGSGQWVPATTHERACSTESSASYPTPASPLG
jgi:hypothetical protein